MESYSDAFHIKRHRRRSKKLMMVCAEFTNPDLSSETRFEEMAIIVRRWSLMPSPMLSDAMSVRSTVTSSVKYRDIFIQRPLHGHLRCREWILSVHQPSNIQKTSLYFGHNWHFSKWTEAVPLKKVMTSDVIKFIKHHVLYRFGVPRRIGIVHDNGP